ncbi:hypothetical protein GX553_00695 [Candidatus Peribacteria bacterium]|nr:hypothetical protein [Candidatus Peribacteria bacterium]
MSIDYSLPVLWHCFTRFIQGKKHTAELEHFRFHLEANLRTLEQELNNQTYKHGTYRSFSVNDTKSRDIAVASIRDRFVHRLLYEYLVTVYDKTFLYDVWSCRKEKGLLGAIERTQYFLTQNRNGYFWRGDVQKFFDSVNQRTLLALANRRIEDPKALWLLKEVIASYRGNDSARFERERERLVLGRGIAIGNVTSQIFANIYMHEFDRYAVHTLRSKHYLRYGDDFMLFTDDRDAAIEYRERAEEFLREKLSLHLHSRNDVIFPCMKGAKFLGCWLYPQKRHLQARVWHRALRRVNKRNIASYNGLIHAHSDRDSMHHFDWHVLDCFELNSPGT